MTKRTYGQYCGFARALEMVGERWALLIIRDLLVGPKRFGEIQRGLPGIPTNILTSRLKELEDAGLVGRRVLPRPARGIAYALTDAGATLEEAVLALGRWGAEHLGEPRPDEVITEDSIATALLTSFQPEAARKANVSYVVRLGEIEVNARVRNGAVTVGRGPLANPDLIIETGPALRALMAREITPYAALRNKQVRVIGDRALLERFVHMFRI